MKIWIVKSAGPMDGSLYLEEIFSAFGFCFVQRCELSEALVAAQPANDILILPAGSQVAGIERFLHAGGSVVAICPDASLEQLAGLTLKTVPAPSSLRLRFAQPICIGTRGESLLTLGNARLYEPAPGPQVIAYLSVPGDATSDSVGITQCIVGNGKLILYAYDPVLCIARLRQGYPDRSGVLPIGQRVPRAAFLQYPEAPHDTFWRPTADLHAQALCEIARRELSRQVPIATLWHLPQGSASILLFSGDEDNSEQSASDQQMSQVESAGGAMNLYVIPDLTSITRQHIEQYTRRGHHVSVHPNLLSSTDKPLAAQLEVAETQVRLFRETFDWPARTARNHFYFWPGYLEMMELWQRLGIGMDASTCATLHYHSLEFGPYANVHSAIPLRFVREDGELIDVYHQPTHVNDDLLVHPDKFYSLKYSPEQFECIAQRMFDEAASLFHAPICANVHPGNYVVFSAPSAKTLLAQAHQRNLPIWSIDRWHEFWRSRATWRQSDHSWDGHELRFNLCGSSCESLWVMLPPSARGGASALSTVTLNGNVSTLVQHVVRYGVRMAQVPLPPGAIDVQVVARYEGTIQ